MKLRLRIKRREEPKRIEIERILAQPSVARFEIKPKKAIKLIPKPTPPKVESGTKAVSVETQFAPELGAVLLQLAKLGAGAREEKPKEIEGIEIPKIAADVKLPEFEEEELRRMSIRYPLIPRSGRPRTFAEAYIYFDERTHEFVYEVVEPQLTSANQKLLARIKEFIQEKVDVDFTKLRKGEAIKYLASLFEDALSYFKVRKSKEIEEVMKYYIYRDFLGLERIEPLLHDPNLEDISCDGVGIPIYVYHKDPRFGSMRTNVKFDSREELDGFVMRLAERCGKTISLASPLLDGTLPDGSRVQATLGSDIARRGSNFTIRKFTEKPLTPVDLLQYGTCDLTTMAYLWMAVEYGRSILISGGAASGKTTLLNVLSMFIKPQLKVVSIEDTAELRLAHPHWVPHVARVPIAAERREVDLFELLRASLRQRPDYVILGEVRGKEAYVLFQQMALGHGALATIHAENFARLVDRLTSPPISLPASLLQSLDVVVFISRVRKRERYVRRVSEVIEIVGYDRERKHPITNEVIRWNSLRDEFEVRSKSVLLKRIAEATGFTREEIRRELEDKAKVLQWLTQKNVKDYRLITKVVNMFYASRERLMERVEMELV